MSAYLCDSILQSTIFSQQLPYPYHRIVYLYLCKLCTKIQKEKIHSIFLNPVTTSLWYQSIHNSNEHPPIFLTMSENNSSNNATLEIVSTFIQPFVPNTTQLISLNVASQLLIKLTTFNYTTQHVQCHYIFFGYNLLRFLDDILPCPSLIITVNTEIQPNPTQPTYFGKDKTNSSFMPYFPPYSSSYFHCYHQS